jgi:hypothetical protein
MPRRRTTLKAVPAPSETQQVDVVPVPEPGTQEALQLIEAARQHPLAVDEVVVRLGQLLRRDFNYKAYRRRNGQYTAYDEVLEQSMEAVASAIVHLQGRQQP